MRQRLLCGAVLAGVLLSGCENTTNKATDVRLMNLLDNGLDAKAQERLDARLSKAVARGDKTNDLSGAHGDLQDADIKELGAFLVAALERNPRIGAAAQGINLADARRLNAIFGYLPQVKLILDQNNVNQVVVETDNAVFQQGEAKYPVKTQQLRLEQPIFDLARIFGIQHASNARSLAEVEYIRTVRDVAFEVFDAYVVAGQAKTQSQMLRRRMSLLSRQITSQSVLDASGLGDAIQKSSLASERASLAAEEALNAAKYAEAMGSLARLTGVAVSDVPKLSLPREIVGAERKVSAAQAVATGLQENPLVMAAALTAVGADLERKTALADDFSPVLMAYASIKKEDRADSRFGGGSVTEDTTVGVALTIPLFNATGEGYAMLPATVAARSAVLDYHAQRRELETSIRTTHARLGELNKAMGQAGRAVSAARRALRSEEARSETGQSADIAVAARKLRLEVARERAFFYQSEYLRAWGRLQYLVGADLGNAPL